MLFLGGVTFQSNALSILIQKQQKTIKFNLTKIATTQKPSIHRNFYIFMIVFSKNNKKATSLLRKRNTGKTRLVAKEKVLIIALNNQF